MQGTLGDVQGGAVLSEVGQLGGEGVLTLAVTIMCQDVSLFRTGILIPPLNFSIRTSPLFICFLVKGPSL